LIKKHYSWAFDFSLSKKKTKENNVDCARNMMSTSLRVFIKSERFNLDSGEDEIFFFAFRLSIYMPKWMDSAVRGRRDGLSQAAHGKRQRIYYGEGASERVAAYTPVRAAGQLAPGGR
jgi:hypothetical protein